MKIECVNEVHREIRVVMGLMSIDKSRFSNTRFECVNYEVVQVRFHVQNCAYRNFLYTHRATNGDYRGK